MGAVLLLPSPIARLNDAFRTTLIGGKVMLTAGIAELPERTRANILTAVRTFADFSEDNDPHGEHDFGAFEADGHKCFWKIDYYDKSMESGSKEPANPDVTTRVLTIMLASEY